MSMLGLFGFLAASLLSLAPVRSASAGSMMIFDADQRYRGAAHSPFTSGGGYGSSSLQIEDFEDGVLNSLGVSVNRGKVKGPGKNTDSVDGDDGSMNGMGRNGHSFSSGKHKSLTFRFNSSATGALPTMAGLVFTDGKPNSKITFKAWDANGDYIGKIKVTLGDLDRRGKTREDRFLGVMSDKGISKIVIRSNKAGFEIDHLQFNYGLSVVPLPSAVGMGLAGLAGMGLVGTRRRR